MRFIVVQIGARRGYAVPAILEEAGLLEHFYTDLTADVGLGKWLVKCGSLMDLGRAAKRLAGRRLPESIRPKTTTFGWPTLWFASGCALRQADPATRFRRQLRWNRSLGLAMARRGFGEATHLYSMLGECGPMQMEARRRGLTIVTEIYILLSAEGILKREQSVFPQWEPPPPNFEAARREFGGETSFSYQNGYAVCPSEIVRHDLVENFGACAARMAVVPYGVEEKWFSLQTQPAAGRILFVGTAGLRKGIVYLAKAAEQLRAQGREYEFRVAGDVTVRVADQPACRCLHFLGRVPRSVVHREYAQADVFVLPSLAEGSAEVTYEALACGLPVITTAAAGSVVRDGIEGRIVLDRNALALAEAIDELIQDRTLRARMSQAARCRAAEYRIEHYGERLVSALRSFQP